MRPRKRPTSQRKSQKTQEIKEIKMRPNIDDHDYDTKMKKVFSFIERGRQGEDHHALPRSRAGPWRARHAVLLQRVQADISETAKVEQHPRMEGRQMLMVLAPK
jgi:translation initiation factor IF-3